MKVVGLDGRNYNLDLRGHVPLGSEQGGSSGHVLARELLYKLFPMDTRSEEVTLPGSGGLRADFLIPARRLVIEVQGRQHREYVPHFHKDRLEFLRAQQRDRDKEEWCVRNNFRYVALNDDRPESWVETIRG